MGVVRNIDPVLDHLGARGCYQLMQMTLIAVGTICAQNQLFDIIFIGKDVPYQCAAPPVNVTNGPELSDVFSNSSDVTLEQCVIVVSANVSGDVRKTTLECVHGYMFHADKDASFMSEFELVCDSYLLVSLTQTLVVLGQGVGAFVASIISDRFGRKPVLVGSQLGLLLMGVAIGAAPSYPVLAFFKFMVGTFQQGVLTAVTTAGIELFPRDQRSLLALISNLWWAAGACSMALVAYVLRFESWRVLQYALSSLSLLVVLLQFFYVDESIRWLVDNGKNEGVMRVLKRAARANSKDLDSVISALRRCQQSDPLPLGADICNANGVKRGAMDDLDGQREPGEEGLMLDTGLQKEQEIVLQASPKLSFLDVIRHRRLLKNSLLTFFAWFTVAFVVFTLYMMSTSYSGDPYLNYFLVSCMEIPPAILLFFGVDRLGRKRTVQAFFALAGLGCFASAILLVFKDNLALNRAASVFAMLGMVGGSGAFGGLFFFTPEYFPTNFRNQALGTSSTVGRLGGMVAPFMKNLGMVALWAPGLITGSLCASVLLCVHFLPETKGRELPTDIHDIEAWYRKDAAEGKPTGHTYRSQEAKQTDHFRLAS